MCVDDKKDVVAIIGLGYVGLPLAVLFSKKYDVIGFDIDSTKVDKYKQGIDVTGEFKETELQKCSIFFTDDENYLDNSNFKIISVPTPILEDNSPDLNYIRSASSLVSKHINKGDFIIYESTVYPGVTEDICLPILENGSNLKCFDDFYVGYSPERVSPGDKGKSIENITKIVSACDEFSLERISNLYNSVLKQGIYKAKSIKIAEAAKITENIQRDVNIALMNELSIIFNKLDINTMDVIEAASTKWNFNKYTPGLVGGHCIGVDPYYLIYKSNNLNYTPKLIETSRNINEHLVDHIIKNIMYTLVKEKIQILESDILVCGITFKENCNDIRNSKIVDVINELKNIGINVEIYDPIANADEVQKVYGFDLITNLDKQYDAIVMAVSHDVFDDYSVDTFKSLSKKAPILFDLKSQFAYLNNNNNDIVYWSL